MPRCLPTLIFLACAGALSAQSNPSAQVQPAPATQAQSQNSAQPGSVKPSADSDGGSGGGNWLHVHLGTVSLGGGYFSGPFYPYGPYPFNDYGPYPYSPFTEPMYSVEGAWVPYARGGRAPHPFDLSYRVQRGEVKLSTDPSDADVYIDGALAGTSRHLKRMWLDPGAYDLAVSSPGMETYHQRLYVLSGKSLKVEAKLSQPN